MKYLIAIILFKLAAAKPFSESTWPNKIDPPIVDIPLVTFDGAESTTFKFHELNDPVMGGVSSGTWNVSVHGHVGIFNGTVRNVPALQAPGFIAAFAAGNLNDASMALNGDLVLKVCSTTSDYNGFRVSFSPNLLSAEYSCAGGGTIPFSNGCFKAHFTVPSGNDFVEVRIPFSSFSDHWDPATGEQITTCSDEHQEVCPKASDLKHIRWIEVWAEGVAGDIHLELKSIFANLNIPQRPIKMKVPTSDIPLITFDEEPATSFKFRQYNDPVMGGISSGTWSVNEEGEFGVEDGTVRDVPSLQAPGFIKASAEGRFNDVSEVLSGDLILNVRSSIPDYSGYRISFGSHFNAFKDFKAKFSVPTGENFSQIRIPFNMFSNKWDPATGDQTVTCADDPKVCPTAEDLSSLRRFELWAEGAKGDAHFEVQMISAGIKPIEVTIEIL